MYILMRRIAVSVLVSFVVLALRLASAQQSTTRSHAQVRLLFSTLRLRSNGLAIRGQVATQELAQLQMVPQTFQTQMRIDRLQSRIVEASSALQTVQTASILVGQLDEALGVANRLNIRIQLETSLLVRLQTTATSSSRSQARITNVQNALKADQAALQVLQQQIATLQQQVSQLFD